MPWGKERGGVEINRPRGQRAVEPSCSNSASMLSSHCSIFKDNLPRDRQFLAM